VLAVEYTPFYFPAGVIFGGALVAYFALCERQRDLIKLGLLMAACAACFPAAIFAGLRAMFFLHAHGASQDTQAPLLSFGIAGGTGTFLVVLTALSLFGSRYGVRYVLVCSLFGALGGAVLGVLGGMAHQRSVSGADLKLTDSILIWQPGTALILGLMLKVQRPLEHSSGNP